MGRQVIHFGDDLHHRGTKKVDHLERILIEQVNIFLQANQNTIVSLLIKIYISYIIYEFNFSPGYSRTHSRDLRLSQVNNVFNERSWSNFTNRRYMYCSSR